MGRRRNYKPGSNHTSDAHRLRTNDGFESFAANLGLGQDNLLGKSGYAPGAYSTRNPVELEDMYRTSWVVGRMVEVVAEDMVRGGVDIQSELEPGKVDELLRAMKATGIPGRLADAIKWGRLYGGALAVMLIKGDALEEPLAIETIGKGDFTGLFVLDRHQVSPSTETITELGPLLGYPEFYTINQPTLSGERVHHSRCIRFIGVDLPHNQRVQEQFWGASVVERAYDRILALDSATHGSANLLYKSFLRVVRVNRLREILASGGKPEQALLKMFTMIRQLQSNEGITLLDKEDEFATHGYSFAGVYDALQAFAEQISGATGIPLVRLMGQSPKGFSTGESDLRIYYDTIATQQEDDLRPGLNTLFPVLARSLWEEALPDGFSFDFRSLYLPTELEKSQIATADAQGIAGLHGAAIITTAQALAELRDAGRVTGRFSSITDVAIASAEQAEAAPPLPEGEGGEGGVAAAFAGQPGGGGYGAKA